ncbi:MAG: S1 RNA-binding domain-containing protein [Candidatus Krumholzibacteriota bacterium]
MTSDQNENPTGDAAEHTEKHTAESTENPQTSEAPQPEAVPSEHVSEDAGNLVVEETNEAEENSTEFAELLAAADNAEPTEAQSGDKLTGRIVQIDGPDAFVDCGLRNELPIAVAELKDGDGEMKFKVGDEITAYVQKAPGGLKLTMAVNLKEAGVEALTAAFAAGTPVKGKVGSTNKGGFSVDLDGTRAFCPFSQIDVRRADNPEQFVGQTFQFKILELSEDGRNIVVSRRTLLQADRESQAEATRESLALGENLEGVVTRLVPFGAFVDIGGLEGLVHISQISHQRVGDPGEVLKEGQTVKVKVLEIQNLGMGRSERISLSIKALATDPWPETARSMVPGQDVEGRVTRLVDFGVFVELQPGVEGLIHISELANRRVIHPREVMNEDEQINVRILDVDLDRRRISLSRKQASDYEED